MSIHASSDLEELFRLNITFDTTNGVTIETKNFSDRARGVRQGKSVTRWKNGACLGQGSSGTVWMQQEEQAPEKCRAVKQIPKGTRSTPLPVDYRRELLALGRLSRHDDLFVHFLGWYEDKYSVYLAMEYFEQGDLARHLESPLAEDEVKVITKQLLEGLVVLHNQNWAHRDLKPPNIFVVDKSPWWIKIGDFGISKRICSDNTRFRTMIGTPDFVAPEVLHSIDVGGGDDDDDEDDREEEYTVAVDLWSLGCVVFQLLTSEVPFTNRKKLGAYCRNKFDRFPIGLVSRFASAAAIEMIKQLLEPLPSARTTALAALDHTWLRAASELPVGHSTPLAPSVEVARHSKANTDFQAEGRASVEGHLQKKGEKSPPPGLNERIVSKNDPKTKIYKPPSTPPTQTRSDRKKLGTASKANVRAKGHRTAERFSDTRRASPVVLPERMAKANRKNEQQSKPQITSKSDKDMSNGQHHEKVGVDAISTAHLLQDAGRGTTIESHNLPTYQAQIVSTPNRSHVFSFEAGNTLPYGPELSVKPRDMQCPRGLVIDHTYIYKYCSEELLEPRIMFNPCYLLGLPSGRPAWEGLNLGSCQWLEPNQARRENAIEALRWLVQDAKSGDSLFVIFSGLYPPDWGGKGAIVNINEDELYNLLIPPLPAGVQLTVVVDRLHGDPPLRMNYIYGISPSSAGLVFHQPRSVGADGGLSGESFAPQSTAPLEGPDQNPQASVLVWYHSIYKRNKANEIRNPLSRKFGPIIHDYHKFGKPQRSYRDALKDLKSDDLLPILASNYPIDLDSEYVI